MTGCTTTVWGRGINIYNCSPLSAGGTVVYQGRATLIPVTIVGYGCPGLRLYLDGVDQGFDYTYYPDAYIVSTTCDPQEKYDCINGACTPSTTYDTPGIYSSLAECEVACGTGCSGKCLSNAEWAQIEGLASQLKNKNCS